MKIKFAAVLVLVVSAILMQGCTKSVQTDYDHSEEPPEEPSGPSVESQYFNIGDDDLSFDLSADAAEQFIPVDTNIPVSKWKVTTPESWCRVTTVDGGEADSTGLSLEIEANDELEVRQASFKVSASVDGTLCEYEIVVRQLGTAPAILVEDVKLPASGGSFALSVTANLPVAVGLPEADGGMCGWIEVADDGRPLTRAMVKYEFECYAFPNVVDSERSAVIKVASSDKSYELSATLRVTQAAGSGIKSPEYGPDTKLRIQSATASSVNPSSPVEKLFDGIKEYDTDYYIYHSLWSQNGGTNFPVTVTFRLASASRVSYFNWHSRFSENANGNPGKFDVHYRLKGEAEFRPVKSDAGGSANAMYDMDMSAGIHCIRFPRSIDNVEEVRLTFYTGRGGYIAGVETEFFSSSRNEGVQASLDKVFTDSSYSELRPGVTRQDIAELYEVSPYFAEKVALPLFSGTYTGYERDFRIGTYAAYSNGEDKWLEYRTRKYTRMDNPTGIFVKQGDKLTVCVGPLPAGNRCYIGIAGESSNHYTARYDDFDAATGDLVEGINEIEATASGMCYVVNRAGNLTSSSAPVKVHFIPGSGRAEGYFDLKRHKDDDYRALIGATTEKYFVAKGTNIIFNMHTATLRKYAPDGISSGLKAWDDILGWQFELMGLAEQKSDGSWDRLVDRTHFNNHMVAVSSSEAASYMDASNYRINFNIETIPKIISLEALNKAEDNTWGPAHEAGHVNQMFMLWKSTAESSNNLFSNYAIYKMGVYNSRGSRVDLLADYYARRKSWVEMGNGVDTEDTEMHMRLNWQLWNYFHRCGVDTGFWPRLYGLLCSERYRLPNEQAGYYGMQEDNGKCQMLFAEAVCEAAKMDFTDFFEAWGFLRPVDIKYSQYGTQQYTVTQSMVDALKAKMASYPNKAPAIHFIEDREDKCDMGYYTTFRDKTPVSGKPTYSLASNNVISVTGCTGAVGVEIRGPGSGSALGELRYFCNWYRFVIPQNVSTANMKVYVVQWDGKRFEVTP